ncbi:efflux ABC transporter, permease protein [Clostridiales bacterium oral taxon 876 str. F0540]|nr:efflux ABC transporter, permease protein [Clostridiales bacterium oral taxon 876 str. F0540]
MVFSIMIYFTFTSIQYNTQVQELVGSSMKLSTVFNSAAVVIAIFVAVFIWYSNSFFTKKRKKEIALYSLLGIRKKQIGRMLFYENIVMGIAALLFGIFIGGLLSKLFIMLLVKLMGFSADIVFIISTKAIINTSIVFAILFLITSIHGYRLIYKFKLIELFKAENQGEKEPEASIILSIGSILFIGGGYLVYTKGLLLFGAFSVLITLILTVIGTFMLFSSLTLYIIKLSRKNKKRYYKGINMIGTSQLLYRIKGSARTLATIAVLSATTLTAMEVSSSFYYDYSNTLEKGYAFTYALAGNDDALYKKVEDTIAKYPNNKLLSSVDINFVKVTGTWPNVMKSNSNTPSNKTSFYMLSESKYNEIIKAWGIKDKIKISNADEAVVFDPYYRKAFMNSYIGNTITTDGKSIKIVDCKDYSLANNGMINEAIVVKDEVYNSYLKDNNVYRIKGYITANKKDSKNLTKELEGIVPNEFTKFNGGFIKFTSFYNQYISGFSFSGVIIFIGAFLGLLFLVATGSIIFFKQLSEANEDKSRYRILKNIGVTNKEIRGSISKQIFMIFALPLAVGIMHSLVASTLLEKAINTNLTMPIILTISAYSVIYMIYYFLTVSSYYNIVNSKN